MMQWGILSQKIKESDGDYQVAPRCYFNAIQNTKAIPLLVPLLLDEETINEVVERMDAFLFTDGEVVAPAVYGDDPSLSPSWYALERDRWELAVMRRALEKNKPLLCIGRGMQLLNIALGGTAKEVSLVSEYAFSQGKPLLPYAVETTGSHPLGQLLSSWHCLEALPQQQIQSLGEGLCVTAQTKSNIPFAIYHEHLPVWGVEMGISSPSSKNQLQTLVELFFHQHLHP